MLRLLRLKLENFGPYKGPQEIVFPSTDGVLIVYGENMRGKTTLLNAFRYAFFGTFIGRGQAHIPIHRIGNWESYEEGDFGFSVELEFTFGPDRYVLTRVCKPRPGIQRPTCDDDYLQERFLTKEGAQLGIDQATHQLALMMPEEVSRFFLFDGELLQQYEDLLRDDGGKGEEIKQAIERILGLPIITNGRLDSARVLDRVTKIEAKAAATNLKTQQLGSLSQTLLAKQDGHKQQIDHLHDDIGEAKRKKASIEEALKRFDKIKAMFIEKERLTYEKAEAEVSLQKKRDRMREIMADGWRIAVAGRLAERRATLEGELVQIRSEEEKRLFARKMCRELEGALVEGTCETCGHHLDDGARVVIREHIEALKRDIDTKDRGDDLRRLESKLALLRQLQAIPVPPEAIRELQEALDETKVRIGALEARISELVENTRNADESEVRRLQAEYDQHVRDMTILEQGLEKETWELTDTVMRLKKVQDDLKKLEGHDLARHRQKRELCSQLHALFSAGVDAYRQRLKEKVQTDATALFLELTTEPEYRELLINDNYGLNIVHNSGQTITVRSAGAEHVVALSLMGALQRNAPLRGPIVMDSPFGRLDTGHTERVVRALHSMAPQVALLVYESELDPDMARAVLQSNLAREYRIVRKTGRHSVLERQV